MAILNNKLKELNKRRPFFFRVIMVFSILLVSVVGFVIYNQYIASATSSNKFLTSNGATVNTASVSAGTYTNTTNTTSDNTYLTLRESADLANGLSWEFTGWNPLNTSTEATGSKVTSVVVTLEAAVGDSTFSSGGGNGSKTMKFKMWNYNTSAYDAVMVTPTVTLNNRVDSMYTFTFPSLSYNNYFDVNGNFKMQMENTADGDALTTYMRIDYIYATIKYDKTAPTATLVSPSGTTYTNGGVPLALTATGTDNADAEESGIKSMNFYYKYNAGAETQIATDNTFDSGDQFNGTWVYNWNVPVTEGSYSVYARSVDNVGNASANTAAQTVYVDRTAPTAILSSPATGSTIGVNCTFQGTATDAIQMDHYELEYNQVGSASWTQIGSDQTTPVPGPNGTLINWDATGLNEGQYNLRLTVFDKAGNSSTSTVLVNLDPNPPMAATMSNPFEGDYLKGIINLEAYAQDYMGVASVDFIYSNTPTFTIPTTLTGATLFSGNSNYGYWRNTLDTSLLAEGDWYIRARATDIAGNQFLGPSYITVHVDRTSPTVSTMSSPTNGATIGGGNVNLDVNAQDNIGVKSVVFQYATNTSFNSAVTLSGATKVSGTNQNGTWREILNTTSLASGTWYLRAITNDNNSNTLTGSYITVTVDSSPPTAATMLAPANNSTVKGTINLDANAQDPNAVNSVNFEYANNPGFASPTTVTGATIASGNNINGTWRKSFNTAVLADGDWYIRAKAMDAVGNVYTGTAFMLHVDNNGPKFSIGYYTDSGLNTPLLTYNGKPITKIGTSVYVKVTPSEALSGNPTLTISAPGTLNDRNNVSAPLSGGSYVYKWDIVNDTDGDTTLTVSGTDINSNTSTNIAPTSGGTVTIDSAIATPTLTAVNGSFEVGLSWTTQTDIVEYYIYRSTSSGFTPGSSNLIATIIAPTNNYTDSLGAGTYYYKIQAKDYAGNIATSSQTTGVALPILNANATVEFRSVIGGNNQVSLTWNNPGGVQVFELRRSTDGENFSLVYTDNTGTVTSYTDNGVTNYIDYYYKLTAKNTSNNVVVDSEVAHAFPPDTSPHGHYANNTALCAACHVTHTASGAQLIKEMSKVTLCTSCHDGTLSKYNVLKGENRVPDTGYYASSSAGPFGMLTTGSSIINTPAPYNYNKGAVTSVSPAPTSIHILGTRLGDAPGNKITVSGASDIPLECNSCHDPHNTSNFRMLKINMDTSYSEADNKFIAYAKTQVTAGTNNDSEVVTYRSGSINFCSYCHSDFYQSTGSGHSLAKNTKASGFDISNDSLDKVMHSVDVNPLYSGSGGKKPTDIPYENDGTNGDKIMCLTCHRAHGTTASGTVTKRNAINSTVLKRKDDALLCEGCHDKTNNP